MGARQTKNKRYATAGKNMGYSRHGTSHRAQREKIKKVRENMFVNYEGIRKRIEFLENEIKRVSLICQRKNIMSM